jgi:hypothetical protein
VGAAALTIGRVYVLYMLLALASVVFLGSEDLSIRDHIYCLRFETSFFVASYDSQGHGGGIRPRLHTGAWLRSKCSNLKSITCPTFINSGRTEQRSPPLTVRLISACLFVATETCLATCYLATEAIPVL